MLDIYWDFWKVFWGCPYIETLAVMNKDGRIICQLRENEKGVSVQISLPVIYNVYWHDSNQ